MLTVLSTECECAKHGKDLMFSRKNPPSSEWAIYVSEYSWVCMGCVEDNYKEFRKETEGARSEAAQYFKELGELGQSAGGTIRELRSELDDARDTVLDLFCQACSVTDKSGSRKYDHMFHGTYEYVQKDLIKWGLIKAEDCIRK